MWSDVLFFLCWFQLRKNTLVFLLGSFLCAKERGHNISYGRIFVGDEQLVGENHRQWMAKTVQANRQAAKRQNLAECNLYVGYSKKNICNY